MRKRRERLFLQWKDWCSRSLCSNQLHKLITLTAQSSSSVLINESVFYIHVSLVSLYIGLHKHQPFWSLCVIPGAAATVSPTIFLEMQSSVPHSGHAASEFTF